MRFFKADVTCHSDVVRNPDELGDLYEQVGKRAVVVPEGYYNRSRIYGCDFDDEHRTIRFPVFVFANDSRTTVDDAAEIVREACGVWKAEGLEDVVSIQACEAAFGEELGGPSNWASLGKGSLLQKGNLFELRDFASSRKVFKDWIVQRRDEGSCRKAARAASGYSQSLGAELDRVFSVKPHAADLPAPVHYIVEGCERVDCQGATDVLFESLLAAGRLPSGHVCKINFDHCKTNDRNFLVTSSSTLEEHINPALAHALAGNVIVLEYGRFDDRTAFDDEIYRGFCQCIEVLAPYFDESLVVFSVPSGRADLKRRIRKMAGVPLAEISPDAVPDARSLDVDEALAIVSEKARERGLVPDDGLRALVEDRMQDASFADLDEPFDDWRRSKLVAEEFPAYAPELESALGQREPSEPGGLVQLDELIGLGDVKRQIKDIIARCRMNREVARAGLPVQTFSKHMAFVGAPGTGKTEVARLYGQILKEAGVLSEGRVVCVSGAEPWRVADMFDRARGSVLFIDEAYALAYTSRVTELIAYMEDRRDDTVVILAGYEAHMDVLLASNPGFASRIGFTLKFPDYTAEEKLQIFELMCRRARLELPEETRRDARDLLARGGKRTDQGNARYVRKLFEDAIGAQQVRLAREHAESDKPYTARELATLLPADLPGKAKLDTPPREKLAGLIGLDEVKGLVAERVDYLRVQRMRRDEGLESQPVSPHMAFTGAPGTGKTEVARIMGEILREEGALSVGDFYEVAGHDLLSGMPGMSGQIVDSLFQAARGSVVFIDEAYSLMYGPTGSSQEAITALIRNMEELRDEVVVILAGYESEVSALLRANPGFESRVRTKIAFPDYTTDELVEIFRKQADAQKLACGDGVLERVREEVERARCEDGFGNARFTRNLLEGAVLRQGARIARLGDSGELPPEGSRSQLLSTLEPEDVEPADEAVDESAIWFAA